MDMKVSELAKELKTSDDVILSTLKALRLKAKDRDQVLNSVVVSVLRSQLGKGKEAPKGASTATVEPPKVKTAPAKTEKETPVKEKAAAKTKVELKPVEKKTAVKKTVTKAADVLAPKVEKPKAVRPKEEAKEEAKKEVKKESPAQSIVPPAPAKPIVKEAPSPAPEKVAPPKPKTIEAPFVSLKPIAKKRKRSPSHDHGHSFDHAHSPTIDQRQETSAAGAAETTPADASAEASQLPSLEVKMPISIKDFSAKIQQKTSDVLKTLMQMGIMATINQNLDEDILRPLSTKFGFNLIKGKTQEEQLIEDHRQEEEDPKLLKTRAPVVTFMGHVDHGKTSLLDRIRRTKVADSEHGGITQHIGAYSVELPKGRITFLDTPGHEAFTAMRARGAHVTDIVVLVVAADEGIMPQTEEAINHAQAAGVPIVVALNKIDRQGANADMVKKQLNELGLMPEDWGGKVVVVGVSALTGQGIDQLLEMILLEAEMLEVKANYDKKASGIVIEAHLSGGRGVVASLIVQSGILKVNDVIVAGQSAGKIKAMFDDHKRPVKEAGPSMPVEILGLSEVPEAGSIFYVVEDEKLVKDLVNKRQQVIKNQKLQSVQRITLEDLYTRVKEGTIKELNVIIKADVQGSLEALKDSLSKIPSDEVKIKFIHAAVGDVNASDVLLAFASEAIIIAFHVDVEVRAKQELEKQPVDIRQYRIIYDAVNDMVKALEGLLEPRTKKKFLSRIEIRQVMKLSKSGIVAGCYVQKGKVVRKANVDVIRNGEIVHSGVLSSLKRFKDDVREVAEGMECGLTISGFDQIQAGDIVEAYELEKISRKL